MEDVTCEESDFVFNICRDQTSGGGSFVFNCYTAFFPKILQGNCGPRRSWEVLGGPRKA